MTLNELKTGDKAVITKVKGHGSFQKRIAEMGFIKGQVVEVIKTAPFSGPIQYKVMGYNVSIRQNESKLIEVLVPGSTDVIPDKPFEGVIDDERLKISLNKHQTINVAFVGNPNCGKTSLFNNTSGSKEHVGNYSGVTVESKHAKYGHGEYDFNLYDLPGTYSLTAYTPEELYVRKFIFNEHPDIVVNVIDATNLERNLYLTTQLIDMDIKVVIALNMYDDLEKSGSTFDYEVMGKLLGIPIIPTVATKGKGIPALFDKIISVYENKDETVRHIHINYGKEVEKSIKAIQDEIRADKVLSIQMSPRFLALKLLEQDKDAIRFVSRDEINPSVLKTAYKEVDRIECLLQEKGETIITDAKYGFINGALKETLKEGRVKRKEYSSNVDKVLTHKYFGFPLFLLFLLTMFYTTFKVGAYPMEWIDAGIGMLNGFLKAQLPPGMFSDLITDGIISGLGSVLVFLPNILILFLFISFMEDTGYMARAAFMMDKLMHKIGLHGRSFIPLIMGFGCNVPAIMATRTIRNHNDRLLTILITPFMSCSARLPVYILFISAFFPKSPTLVLVGLYGTGILLAVISAHFFNKWFFKAKETPFVMELPPYRLPSFKSTVKHMWEKSNQYLKKIGGIILVAVIIIWALGYFPQNEQIQQRYTNDFEQLEQQKQYVSDATTLEAINTEQERIMGNMRTELLGQSYLAQIGRFIEPVIRPLGFEWRMGVALLSGTAAKEVVISTLGVMLNAEDSSGDDSKLIEQLRSLTYDSGPNKGKKALSPLVALSFLVFVLIYSPCIGVVGAIAKESGKWKWALFMVTYTTVLAWIMSFLVYRIGSLIV